MDQSNLLNAKIASDAIKNSSSPTPIAIGLPNLATIISSGFSLSKTQIA